MTDYIAFPPPNALGEAFSESGITGGGGGGGGVSSFTYELFQVLNQVVLQPTDGSGVPTSSVDISTTPAVASAVAKTARITSADNINTYITGGLSFSAVSPAIRPEILGLLNVGTENLILNNNVITTAGTGASAVVKINGSNVLATPATWADYPAGNVVSIPQGTGMNIYDDLNFGTGNIGGYYPDATFYPTNFQVGGGTLLVPNPLTAARNISLYSGVGGTSIASVQGVGIFGGADVDITAGGIVALTATTDINLLAPLITMEGVVNITGENNTIGNTSIEGAFEVVGATTLGGATNITGETTITGLTAITGGLEVSAVANLNGGVAVEGAMGVVGITSLTGSLNQIGGSITTSGSISGNLINTSTITDNGAGSITIRPSSKLELINVSSINGIPYVNSSAQPWYTITALTDIDMGAKNINDCSALSAPLIAGSNLTLIAPIGGITIAGSQGVSITGNAGINLQADLGVNVNSFISVSGNVALRGSTITGVSTINGQPYGGSASDWATFPATSNVNVASNNINNAKLINVAPGQNFSLANSLTTTTIQGGSQLNLTGVANGANVAITAGTGGSVVVNSPLAITASSIVGVSSINGAVYPPVGSAWYNTPAGANVNMNNFNLTNINNVFSQPGDTSFVVGGGNQTSYIRYNDAGNTNYEVNPNAPTMYVKTTTSSEKDFTIIDTSLLFLSTGITTITGQTNTSNLFVSNSFQNNGTATLNNVVGISSITFPGVGGATNITQTIGFPYKQQSPSGGGGVPYGGGFLPYGASYQYTIVGTSFYTNGNTIFGIVPTPTFTNYGDGTTASLLPITFPDAYHFNIATLGLYEINLTFSSMDISLPTTLYKNNGFQVDFGYEIAPGNFVSLQNGLIGGMAYYAEPSNDSVYINAPLTATFKYYFGLAGGFCFRTRPIAYSQNSGTAQLGLGNLTFTYLGQPTNL